MDTIRCLETLFLVPKFKGVIIAILNFTQQYIPFYFVPKFAKFTKFLHKK